MPRHWVDYPQNARVSWPSDEKIIGVVGVAPLATADFYTCLCHHYVEKDWEHPRVLIDSNPKIPSRGRYLELGETDPVPYIRKSIEMLKDNGADIVALPCNTAHILYERYCYGFNSIIIPNIINVTINKCIALHCKKVMVLASKQVIKHRLYQNTDISSALECIIPDDTIQNLISHTIETVKQRGVANDDAKAVLINHINNQKVDGVILGCTELSVCLRNDASLQIQTIDSNESLAEFCLCNI